MHDSVLTSSGNRTDTRVIEGCAHCGEPVGQAGVGVSSLSFCCTGCRTVYDLLAAHNLCEYYARQDNAGISMKRSEGREDEFAALDEAGIARRLLTFSSPSLNRVVWTVPSIHCASCVWLLERLDRLESGVLAAVVDIMRKTVTVDYDPVRSSLRRIAERLAAIGYAPLLRLEADAGPGDSSGAGHATTTRRLYTRIGIAGFAAGNTMMMYIAQYFAGAGGVGWPLMTMFGTLSIALSVPVLLYCASPWFAGAHAALRGRRINLDVPVALGITVLFLRSVFDIGSGHGEGYLDSFNGLVFFLLIGRLFQQKAFDALSFDRTYRSFFPLSVRVERAEGTSILPIEQIKIGDILSVRNGEVVPCDSVIESEIGYVDYSFVTGEAMPVECTKGDIIYSGGKVMGRAIRLIAAKTVSHSELAGMWGRSQKSEGTSRANRYLLFSDRFGQGFTALAITIAVSGAAVWLPDWGKAFSIFTAVLIIACPCALTLAAPITLGSAMGRLGAVGIYLKSMGVLLELDHTDLIVFDKTGTLTSPTHTLAFRGRALSPDEWTAIQTLATHSTHPISRAIAGDQYVDLAAALGVKEELGRGVTGSSMGYRVAIGSTGFIQDECHMGDSLSSIEYITDNIVAAVSIDGKCAGAFTLQPSLRKGIGPMLLALKRKFGLALLSGDSERDRPLLEPFFGADTLAFGCRPDTKIARIAERRAAGFSVLMVGDGLNDAGAMAEADVAIAVSDDTATLVPACDIIMRAETLPLLPGLMRYARAMKRLILVSLIFSIAYNALGITLAILGHLSPMIAAILMPASSLTVIALSVGGPRYMAGKIAAPSAGDTL